MRLIFKNLNVLRSTINAIGTSVEIKDIVEAAGKNLPNLFEFSSFGVFWKEGLCLFLCQEESCPPSFTQEVLKNIVNVFSLLGEEPITPDQITFQIDKRKLRSKQMVMGSNATLKSHLTLPLTIGGEILGGISLNSEQPNAFDAQDLQFFSVIGYQMATSLKHSKRLNSIKNIAINDNLTGLYNRRYFDEIYESEAQKSISEGTPFSIVMIDLDHFKKVNDTFGHTAGDQILCNIADLLKGSIRKRDIVARYGGEEFIFILPETSLEGAYVISERIRRNVEKNTFEVGRNQIHLTLSMGISNFPNHQTRSKEELIKLADKALYEAKRSGRNKVCIFTGKPG